MLCYSVNLVQYTEATIRLWWNLNKFFVIPHMLSYKVNLIHWQSSCTYFTTCLSFNYRTQTSDKGLFHLKKERTFGHFIVYSDFCDHPRQFLGCFFYTTGLQLYNSERKCFFFVQALHRFSYSHKEKGIEIKAYIFCKP